jgi:hypothetical protein
MKFELVKQLNELADAMLAEKLEAGEARSAKNVGKSAAAKVYTRDYLKTKDKPYRKKHAHDHK